MPSTTSTALSSATAQVSASTSWHVDLASAGSAEPPPRSEVNAQFLREKYQHVQLSVDDYRTLQNQGFLKLTALIPAEDINTMSRHMDEVLIGEDTAPGFPKINPSMSEAQRVAAFSRIHNAHRVHALHERFLLHPRILDVLEQLNGPDVLALQSMTFFKQPGQSGQGYHQDSYYIPTLPNTLIGAWVAISGATEENGCLWFRIGSQSEPLYPQLDDEFTHASRSLSGCFDNTTASIDDESTNQLAKVAERYREIPCPASAGDVIFFQGNVLHRSHANRSTIPRRAFVGHYCDARSFVPWNIGEGWEGMEEGEAANRYHILARGDSQLEFARPRFGTPCAAAEPRKPRVSKGGVAMPMGSGGGMGVGTLSIARVG